MLSSDLIRCWTAREITDMILKPFEYFAPQSLQEACKLLEQHDGAKVLAGGQSLLPIMKLNLTEVTYHGLRSRDATLRVVRAAHRRIIRPPWLEVLVQDLITKRIPGWKWSPADELTS